MASSPDCFMNNSFLGVICMCGFLTRLPSSESSRNFLTCTVDATDMSTQGTTELRLPHGADVIGSQLKSNHSLLGLLVAESLENSC